MKNIIYLDNAATTAVDKRVLNKMLPYFSEKYGNPSSLHDLGGQAYQAVDKARKQAAAFLGCAPEEIFFTASATESNNWAIGGLVDKFLLKYPDLVPHVIVSAVEHKAILDPCQYLAQHGKIELTILPVDADGSVRLEVLEKSFKKNTLLVSVMYANNEVGTVQPIVRIGQMIGKINRGRKDRVIFHTDATQAAGYLDCRAGELGVDLLSLSGHKIYGPKGTGLLYVRRGVMIGPLVRGGGQEKGMRSGTENTAGIVGLGAALELAIKERGKRAARIKKLRDKLMTGLMKNISEVQLNGSLRDRLPNNANLVFRGAEGESIVIALAQKGVCVSTASACASHSLAPSHVLLAMGLSHEQAHCSVRFSLGQGTREQDIGYVIEMLPRIVARLRKISGR